MALAMMIMRMRFHVKVDNEGGYVVAGGGGVEDCDVATFHAEIVRIWHLLLRTVRNN